eukprot:TRINITY_DN5689_c0_g2_i1.p1 TRINITY_DN5689_c0_g2~~TRINITY_DN5689_c0_g2_i1.p1  ORF type:complete len:732 (-),score=185.05 TRINITY_DN5689_c0_g2_i1:22-2217(-)
MKFGAKLRRKQVTEWAQYYIPWNDLKKIMQPRRQDREKIDAKEVAVELSEIENKTPQEAFFGLLKKSVDTIEEFYSKHTSQDFVDHFHTLIMESMKMGLMEKYVPMKKSDASEISELMDHHQVRGMTIAHGNQSSVHYSGKEEVEFPIHAIVPSKDAKAQHESVVVAIDGDHVTNVPVTVFEPGTSSHITKRQLKNAWREYYRGLTVMKEFLEVNLEAIEKILKKWDKKNSSQMKRSFTNQYVRTKSFYDHDHIPLLMSETEQVFGQLFTNNNRQVTLRKLRAEEESSFQHQVSTFRAGMNLGAAVVLAIMICYFMEHEQVSKFPRFRSVMIIYRMGAMGVLMVWAWSINMYLWDRFKVNYRFIFGFDHRYRFYHYQSMFASAATFTAFLMSSLFLYLFCSMSPDGFDHWYQVPWQLHPLVFFAVVVLISCVLQVKSKYWFMETFSRVIRAPFLPVEFRDFFLCDTLNSVVIVLSDLEYSICFFLYDCWSGTDHCLNDINQYAKPIIALVPLTWRVLQNIRRFWETRSFVFILGIIKMSLGITVAILSALNGAYKGGWLWAWVFFSVISFIYGWYTDVTRDWGIPNVYHLRPKLMYPRPFYYIAIVLNFFLRGAWTLSISPETLKLFVDPLLFAAILAAVEIMRRCMWNLFRVEHEQLKNVQLSRTINEIPVEVQKIRHSKKHASQISVATSSEDYAQVLQDHYRDREASNPPIMKSIFDNPLNRLDQKNR